MRARARVCVCVSSRKRQREILTRKQARLGDHSLNQKD